VADGAGNREFGVGKEGEGVLSYESFVAVEAARNVTSCEEGGSTGEESGLSVM